MATFTFKCKACGGNIAGAENATFATCEYCGNTSTLPKVSDEREANLFNRANHLRQQNEFDKAAAAYEGILSLGAPSAEAHWGLVLAKYGIEYVEDPATRQRVPTCHRAQSESILADADYLAALENAGDSYTKSLYEDEAKRIAEIQKGILAISSKEAPYDVFICYKESANDGGRTKDSALAQDLYYVLEKEGRRVFFSRISLESKLGRQYEPYIFNALNTAKVMLVVGTKPEHFNAVWVKNEWSRFLALMKKDSSRLLIPCYRDMDAYDLPEEMSMLQSQDMGKIGFAQDIIHGIKKVVSGAKAGVSQGASGALTTASTQSAAAPGMESLMKRGWLFLEDGDWNQAYKYFNKVLDDINAEHAPAYIGLLCADLKIKNKASLANNAEPLDSMPNYQKALRFAADTDPVYRAKLEGYNEAIKKPRRKEQYDSLIERKNRASYRTSNDEEYRELAKQFRSMNGYKNTEELAKECDNKYCALKQQRQEQYNRLLQAKNEASTEEEYQNLASQFRRMYGYKNTEELAAQCDNQYRIAKERREKLKCIEEQNTEEKVKKEEEGHVRIAEEHARIAKEFHEKQARKAEEERVRREEAEHRHNKTMEEEERRKERIRLPLHIALPVLSVILIFAGVASTRTVLGPDLHASMGETVVNVLLVSVSFTILHFVESGRGGVRTLFRVLATIVIGIACLTGVIAFFYGVAIAGLMVVVMIPALILAYKRPWRELPWKK